MSQYDVLCIGNAIVDVIAQCEEAFLETNGIVKGAMNLIDARRAELLYARMGPAVEASGGSAGNTAAGVASFGGRLLDGAAKVVIRQFFAALVRHTGGAKPGFLARLFGRGA